MLFKRYLFLAACILFYIFGFIAYFTVSRAQIESKFREERVKYNVQGVSLIGTNAAPEAPTPPVAAAPIPAPAPSATPDSSTPTPAAPTSTDSSTVASPRRLDRAGRLEPCHADQRDTDRQLFSRP